MREKVIEVLKGHFGDKPIEDSSHLMDDLGADEFDIIDVILQIEEKFNIQIPEEETFDIMTVSQLLEVVDNYAESD